MIYGACLIVLLILCVGMIPIDLFLFAVPLWLGLIVVAGTAAVLVLYLKKSPAKTWRRVVSGILSVLLIAATLFCSLYNPYWNSYLFRSPGHTRDYDTVLSFNNAKEDINYVMRYLKKDHPIYLDGTPTEITEACRLVIDTLSADEEITVAELYGSVQRILSVLGDAHTTAYEAFDNPHYLKYIWEMRDAGFKLAGVNGQTLEEIFFAKSEIFCYEAESWAINCLEELLTTWEGLALLGLDIDNEMSYTYQKPDGTVESNIYTKADFVTYDAYMDYYDADSGQDNEKAPFVYYEINTDKSLVLLTLTACRYNNEYRDCLKEMFQEIKELGIKNLAVDLRENGGGSSYVANEFIKYLRCDSYRIDTTLWRFGFFEFGSGSGIMQNEKYDALTFDGDLFVLTSTHSFSSAMMFAEYIGDNNLGTLIGEAPGNAPSGYGDVAVFQLPNSGLIFQVSTKKFYRADTQTSEKLVVPDVACDSAAAVNRLYELIG